MNDLNERFSKNLIKYRILNSMTQLELAEKLNYSDKSVSKWERGEGLPDLSVVVKICEIFKITPNDMLAENDGKAVAPLTHSRRKHGLIMAMATFLVLLIATAVFFVLMIPSATKPYAWYCFVYWIPVACIVLTVLSARWGNWITNIVFVSGILWGAIFSICLTLSSRHNIIWVLCAVGIVFEILIILWYVYRKIKKIKFAK